MARYLTDRADERLAELVRKDNQLSFAGEQMAKRGVFYPKLGKANAAITKKQKGTFTLQKNLPDTLTDGSGTLEAWAMCNFAAGDFGSLQWHAVEASGGFWLATRCGDSAETTTCTLCTSDTMPATVSFKYETTHSGASLIGGINFSDETFGTHSFVMSGCSGTKVIEHGDSTAYYAEFDGGQLVEYPIGTPTRSRFVLALQPVSPSSDYGFVLSHVREMEVSGVWRSLAFGTDNFVWDSGNTAKIDCSANRVLTTLPAYYSVTGLIDTSDVQVNP